MLASIIGHLHMKYFSKYQNYHIIGNNIAPVISSEVLNE